MRRSGLLDGILGALQRRLDERGLIDWELFCVDSSCSRASRAAAGAAKQQSAGSRKTTPWGGRAAASGRRSTG